ncbi:CZB domain-containing protein [Thiohalomonas denitrificans]|uniref:Chemoreceptor zinc-binding domain-containing protein n=1 Tax=Thiohalomonas denitrificans TaxID=415747 RepID=A0A1G5PR49_9GAMM|nr:CZB domain-containing protein [Thiohalomonas denitrificans]SCZ51878.1 Chemoreceptor zinc-binding domain-containing protein [Thiohalomonas denitrificans]
MNKKSEEIDGFNFLNAIEAHVSWKIRLGDYINGTSEEVLDADIVCRDDQCPLGKWIYGQGGELFGDHPKFPTVRDTHMEFHRCAGDVIRLVDSGKIDAARDMLNKGDYAKYSHRIKSELARLSLELDLSKT